MNKGDYIKSQPMETKLSIVISVINVVDILGKEFLII